MAKFLSAGRPTLRLLAVLTAMVLVVAACGNAGETTETTEAAPTDQQETTTVPDQTTEAPAESEDDPTAIGGEGDLTIRTVWDIDSLDPGVLPSHVDGAVLTTIAEGLIGWDPETGELVNVLAETFEASEDGLRFDFKLKEGIQFHGGYGELTAEDVKYSFERIAGLTDPPFESAYVGDWATLEEVEVTGTYTGTIILSEAFAPLMVTTLPSNAGLVVSKAAIEELGEDFARHPIGTGPYQFVSWTPGTEIVVEAFEDYGGAVYEFAEPPIWDRIVFRPIEDDSAADIAIDTGEADFGEVSLASLSRFEADDQFITNPQTTLDYGWIGFNVTDPVLSDVRVRQAIRQAIDVDSIIQGAFDGQVTRANALISPETPLGVWEDAPVYERDVEAARQLLDEAGVDDLTLTFSIDDQTGAVATAEIVQANLADIGITVDIEMVDGGAFIDSVRAGTVQMFYSSFSTQADPSWSTVWFTCDQVGVWNYMSWCNEEYDELNSEGLVEQDPEKRTEIYVQMQEIMDEEVPAVWVMYRTKAYVYSPDLEPALLPASYGKYAAWDFRQR